jgi:hypothetical protein
MSSANYFSRTTSRAFSHATDAVDFTAGLDLSFLSNRDRARFQRHAARGYKNASKNTNSNKAAAEVEGRASPMPERALSKISTISTASSSTLNDSVPQVCAFRLVSLAEARATASIKYFDLLN